MIDAAERERIKKSLEEKRRVCPECGRSGIVFPAGGQVIITGVSPEVKKDCPTCSPYFRGFAQ